MDWPEGKDFGMSPEEKVMHAEEAPLYNKLQKMRCALFTDGSCQIVPKHRKWKAAIGVLQDKLQKPLKDKMAKSRATKEHQNKQQVDWAAKIEVAEVDLDWQHKGELVIA
ncbi:hypothetical protein llap_15523 [Limosa lapponica baueri]|uniref:Rna-directed dna polymerase from mobile element jockey-like n=1 Tax=Limosa lapponica baueri TaxID=1758121 RepID=A0A2I0TKB5_LIMLA|nr:hypothetical protein llap_15523 [Limosa lapponica baueri]